MAFSMSEVVRQFAPFRTLISKLTTQATEAEVVYLAQLIGELAVVLDDIDVVGAGQKTGELVESRVPEGGRDNVCTNSQRMLDSSAMMDRFTVLYQDIQTAANEHVIVDSDEAERKGENVVTCSHFEELADAGLFTKVSSRSYISSHARVQF